MAGRSVEQKSQYSVCLLEYDGLKFYLQTFTDDDERAALGQDFGTAKKAMVERYSKRKMEAEVIREAVELCYSGGDVQKFKKLQWKICASK